VNQHAAERSFALRGRSYPLSHAMSEANPKVPKRTARGAFKRNWQLYIFEAIELAIFMISACVSTVFLFDPACSMPHILPNAFFRRTLMGVAMGITAVFIIRSPMGKRSGAHFNPAITMTYFRLGKIDAWDAFFYVVFQFLGGVFGVAISALLLGKSLAAPTVRYAVTPPGQYGTASSQSSLWRRFSWESFSGCRIGLLWQTLPATLSES
jgi:glycerol uptake facilitator-like aquaporin